MKAHCALTLQPEANSPLDESFVFHNPGDRRRRPPSRQSPNSMKLYLCREQEQMGRLSESRPTQIDLWGLPLCSIRTSHAKTAFGNVVRHAEDSEPQRGPRRGLASGSYWPSPPDSRRRSLRTARRSMTPRWQRRHRRMLIQKQRRDQETSRKRLQIMWIDAMISRLGRISSGVRKTDQGGGC